LIANFQKGVVMAKVLTETVIKDWIKRGEIIESADYNCAEGIKYDFRLGPRFLKSHFGRIVDFNTLTSDEKRYAVIKPGEVVYVLTEERVVLPYNVYIQLSPKRKLSHLGIHLLGGLTVDPGYNGYMVFGLCNLSSTAFTLEPGKKLVGAVFYELSKDEIVEYQVPDALNDFPEELTTIIKQYKPIESLFLSDEIKRVSSEVDRITRTLETDNEWKNTFKNNLNAVSEKLSEISTQLQVEIKVRNDGETTLKNSDDKLFDAVDNINKNITVFNLWAKILIAVFSTVVAIGVGVIIAYFVKFI
jgi:deoxycytidine triphosphate deaminase